MLNNKGQSIVEYILLLVVVVSIGITIFNSPQFKAVLGNDSDFFKKIKTQMEYSYRHGLDTGEEDQGFNYSDGEENATYFNQDVSETRFFLPLEPYP